MQRFKIDARADLVAGHVLNRLDRLLFLGAGSCRGKERSFEALSQRKILPIGASHNEHRTR
jgi:hypothetical protein